MKTQTKIKERVSMATKRFYYWSYSESYGWSALGKLSGYETLKELKKDCEFDMSNHKHRILKSELIEEAEQKSSSS